MEHTHYSKLVKDIFKVDIMISMGCEVGCPYIGKEFDEKLILQVEMMLYLERLLRKSKIK